MFWGVLVNFGGGIFGRSIGTDIPLYPFRETVHRVSVVQQTVQKEKIEMPDMETVGEVTEEAVGRVMKMQVAAMKRLFDHQLEALNRISSGESNNHE